MTSSSPLSRRSRTIEDMRPDAIGRVRYERPPALARTEEGVFDALLYPNRSLPPVGFALVMGVVIAVNLTLGIYFTTIGAWPVLGFCGLDVLLVWLAFKISYRQGRLHERVRLKDGALYVSRVLPSGHESRWRMPALWVKVHVDNPNAHHATVRVVCKGRTLILGAFLSPKERDAFANALKTALDNARI
ncbi:MAG: DUF2244 domain-containing protein [Pseudomonadota bacterium]